MNTILENLIKNFPDLESSQEDILLAYETLKKCYQKNGKVLVCGNGGSAADAEHIVGELMKGFLLSRPITKEEQQKLRTGVSENAEYYISNLQRALPAISLVSQTSLVSAFINDVASDMVYAQQVFGYGREGDVLIGISTSGNSKNIINAVKVAKSFGLKTIILTGKKGGHLATISDVVIKTPSDQTYRIQEYHLPIYHAICAMIEQYFFGEE